VVQEQVKQSELVKLNKFKMLNNDSDPSSDDEDVVAGGEMSA